MCCKLLPVHELNKPAARWCVHAVKGDGCGVYETRPQSCRTYRCRWLDDPMLTPAWKPERCKFTLSDGVDGRALWINVDPSFPNAWRREPFHSQIRQWSQVAATGQGAVVVAVGARTIIAFPQDELEIVGLDPGADLKVGYRHEGGRRRPLAVVRDVTGAAREYLGRETTG